MNGFGRQGYGGGTSGQGGEQGIYDWQYDIIQQLYPWFFQTPISESPTGKEYYPTPQGYGMPGFMGMQRRGGGDMPSWFDEIAKLMTSPRLAQGMQRGGQGDIGGQLRTQLWNLIKDPRGGLGEAWGLLQHLMPEAPGHAGMSDYEIEQLLQTLF